MTATNELNDPTTPLLADGQRWRFDQGDAIEWLRGLPEDCADLVMFSPPYEDARLYLENGQDFGIARRGETWVAWMADVVRAAVRVCRGIVAVVCEGMQKDWRYSATPFLLLADLVRSGVVARHPAAYHRVGIPGSGHDAWRCDWEPVLLFTREARRLPWSNPTACGHVPKYWPGGACSRKDGSRVNQWGGNEGISGSRRRNGDRQGKARPSHVQLQPVEQPGLFDDDGDTPGVDDATEQPNPHGVKPGSTRRRRGSDKPERMQARGRKIMTRSRPGQHSQESTEYIPPVLANPGNVITCAVGGNKMGDRLAHDNEAAYPESLVLPFVLTFCPPGGLVIDPFSGSGTTVAVAVATGRRGLGCDLRASQVGIATRRLLEVTPPLPGMELGVGVTGDENVEDEEDSLDQPPEGAES